MNPDFLPRYEGRFLGRLASLASRRKFSRGILARNLPRGEVGFLARTKCRSEANSVPAAPPVLPLTVPRLRDPPISPFFLSNSAKAGEVSRRGSWAPRPPALAGFQQIPGSQDAQRFAANVPTPATNPSKVKNEILRKARL